MDLPERQRAEAQITEQARLEAFSVRIGSHLIECGDFIEMLRRCTQTMVDDPGAAFHFTLPMDGGAQCSI